MNCDVCGRERTPMDYDYSGMQILSNQPLGWYSSDDGEMCPECLTQSLRNQ